MSEEQVKQTREEWIEYTAIMRRTLESVVLREIEAFERGTGMKIDGIRLVHLIDQRKVVRLEVQI